jgi:hypothetical protein
MVKLIGKENKQKKKTSTCINFSNPWPRLLEWKHHKMINYEAQSLENKMPKDEIMKKNQLHKNI